MSRAKKDVELWQRWNQSKSEADLTALLMELQGLINKRVNEFRNHPIPPEALRGRATVLTMKALNSYNPNAGAALSTHVTWGLRGLSSFVAEHQNEGRIPAGRARRVGTFLRAQDRLAQDLGRAPTDNELLTVLQDEAANPKDWPNVAEIGRIRTEIGRRELIASGMSDAEDVADAGTAREAAALASIRSELEAFENEERRKKYLTVFDMSQKQSKPAQILSALKSIGLSSSSSEVSRIRSYVRRRLQDWGV